METGKKTISEVVTVESGLAVVNSVTSTSNAAIARVLFSFTAVVNADGDAKGVDLGAMEFIKGHSLGRQYSAMLDMTTVAGDNEDEKIANIANEIVGKKIYATGCYVSIEDLCVDSSLEGVTELVNISTGNTISRLSSGYFGKFTNIDEMYRTLRANVKANVQTGKLVTPDKWAAMNAAEQTSIDKAARVVNLDF